MLKLVSAVCRVEEQQPGTAQHLVFVNDQAVKLLIAATVELFQLDPLADVDVLQARRFSDELTGGGFACSWCACHEDVWGPSGHHAQDRGPPFIWSSGFSTPHRQLADWLVASATIRCPSQAELER